MNRQEIIEYNQRQINLIENRIQLFKSHTITIKPFMDDLYGLIRFIQGAPKQWLKEFDDLLWEMDIIYAVALDDERPLTAADEKRLNGFVEKIELLVDLYKKNYLPSEESDE